MLFPSLFIIFYTTHATSAFYLKLIHPPEFSRENEKISNLQFLLPLQPGNEFRLLKPPAYRSVDQLSHVVFLPDGPFSEIPSEDFVLDDLNVLFDKPAISRITKKDLSRSGPKAYDASDRRIRDNLLPSNNYSPLDIAQRCVQIINSNPSKFQKSNGYYKSKLLDNNYTKTVKWCKAYLSQHAHSDNLETNNQLSTNQNADSASFRGVGNAGVNGYGGYAGNFGAKGHGDNVGNLGIGGIGGVMGNIGIGGVGGVGGDIGSVDDWSSKLISDIVAGNQLVPESHGFNAGNLAVNGFGGFAGNAGFGGKGANAGNLGIGGKGGLFGNLGIGGQGGLFGNVGIGGHAGHFMNEANEGGEFSNTLTQLQSPAPALGSAGVDYSKDAFGTLTAHADTLQAAKEAKFDSVIGNAALHGTGGTIGGLGLGGQGLETGNLGVGGLGGSYGNLNINGLGGLLGNVAIGGLGGHLGNENINGNGDLAGNVAMDGFGNDQNNFAVGEQGMISNVLFENSEAKDAGKLTHIASFSNFKDNTEKEVARILTSQPVDKNVLKYLVGALAHGGTGGQIGNIAIHPSHPTKSSLAREEPCALCVHMLVLKHFIAPKPGQSIRVAYLDANSTVPDFIKDISLGKFRPISGRRDMPLIGGPVSPRFEMYMMKRHLN